MHVNSEWSAVTGLECLSCGELYPFDALLGGCDRCLDLGRAGILNPTYELTAKDREVLATGPVGRLWDYHRFLPVPERSSVVTLGEGGTPLLSLPMSIIDQSEGELYIKYEAVNPTHSYKDRANAVAISAGRYFGFQATVCTSTGNHGVAMAGYAARGDLRSLVLLPPHAPKLAAAEMRFFGAEVLTVESNQAVALIRSLWRDHGWYVSQRNTPNGGGRRFGNPFGMEGYKTIAYEVFKQLNMRVPDFVFVPVAGGDGLWGIFKGFRELEAVGLANSVPRMVACQSAAGAPVVEAWLAGSDRVRPVDTGETIAFSILEACSGDHALRAVLDSRGAAVAVSDGEIQGALLRLGREGVCVEPASAATLAAASKMSEEIKGCVIALVGTGAGVRWPPTFGDELHRSPLPRARGLAELLKYLGV